MQPPSCAAKLQSSCPGVSLWTGSILRGFAQVPGDAVNKLAIATHSECNKADWDGNRMRDDPQEILVARALAVARIRALRLGLLALHKTLIDSERRRYERDHGRIESPQAALRLLLEAPAFQWL